MLKLRCRQLLWPQPHAARRQLDMPVGEVTAVLGRNGTGKTTLLKTHHGPDRPDGTDRSVSTSGKSPASRHSGAPAPASPTFRRAARSFRISPSARISCWALIARADGKRHDPGTGAGAVSLSDRESRSPRRRAFRRTAAAARDRAGASRRAEDHPAGRADRRHPALHRRGNRSDDHSPQPGGVGLTVVAGRAKCRVRAPAPLAVSP